MSKGFLTLGNGHQISNRKKALAYVLANIPGILSNDDQTVDFPPFGRCRFSAYTHPEGAMISTPGRDDNEFGSAEWHSCDHLMLFRDFGDGRCMIYVCPIRPLLQHRTIGHHGVLWADVLKLAVTHQVFRP